MGTVDELPPRKPKRARLIIIEWTTTVGDGRYTIRRAGDRDTVGGFVSVLDEAGDVILILSSSFPDQHIDQAIFVWRTGFEAGVRSRESVL